MNSTLCPAQSQSLPDDIFLVSYPKSGNTWLRFLIGNYLTHSRCNFKNCDSIIPDIHYNPEQVEQLQKPRIIKSHSPFTPEYNRVVYIVRDGRDVAVSYYFYALKFGLVESHTRFEDFILRFNNGTVDDFTPWNHHVGSWIERANQNFLLIKYEDLKANAERELTRFLEFADLPIDSSRLTSAVKASEFSNMQKLEKQQQYREDQYRVFGGSDPNIQFVRKGQVGGWQEFFDDRLLADFIDRHGSTLERLDYLPPGITAGLRSITAQLRVTQANLRQSQVTLEQSQAQQQQLQHSLEQSQVRQQQLEAVLEQSQIQQEQIETSFNQFQVQSKVQRKRLRAKLKQAEEKIAAMESSKFWRLRQKWINLKQLIKFSLGTIFGERTD